MKIALEFVGRASELMVFYDGVSRASWVLQDLPSGLAAVCVPHKGDLVQLRTHPGPDIRTFRCTGRQFDFSEEASPLLRIQLDMP